VPFTSGESKRKLEIEQYSGEALFSDASQDSNRSLGRFRFGQLLWQSTLSLRNECIADVTPTKLGSGSILDTDEGSAYASK